MGHGGSAEVKLLVPCLRSLDCRYPPPQSPGDKRGWPSHCSPHYWVWGSESEVQVRWARPVQGGHGEPMEVQNTQPGWGRRLASSAGDAFLGPELPLLPPRHIQSAAHLISSPIGRTSLTLSPHIFSEGSRTRLPARGCREKPRTG